MILLQEELGDNFEERRKLFRALCTENVSDNFQLFRHRDNLDSADAILDWRRVYRR